jgi:hypothetical protein
MAGLRIYPQLFVRSASSVPAGEKSQAVVLSITFCNFIQQARAEDFHMPAHRQAETVSGNYSVASIFK